MVRPPPSFGLALCVLFTLLGACRPAPAPAPAGSAAPETPGEAAWLLAGSRDQQMVRVAKHLRGFDVAMVEVAHRYAELYWAGRDRNWAYAAYQLEKLEKAVSNGLERRPKRAASAKVLDEALPPLREAIKAKSPERFDAAYVGLTTTCNRCHEAERVAFVHVVPPQQRTSVVGAGTGP